MCIRDRFYTLLLAVLRQKLACEGEWQLLSCTAAWDGNWTSDCFIAFAWQDDEQGRMLVAVNYAPHQSQCYVRLPFADLADRSWQLRDEMSDVVYDRDGADLGARGLYLDLLPWQFHVFGVTAQA